jgi:hypothetical protein
MPATTSGSTAHIEPFAFPHRSTDRIARDAAKAMLACM